MLKQYPEFFVAATIAVGLCVMHYTRPWRESLKYWRRERRRAKRLGIHPRHLRS